MLSTWPKALASDGKPARASPAIAPARRTGTQDRGELADDRELEWLAALGVVDADGHGGHVDLGPDERDHLSDAHAGVGVKAVSIARHRPRPAGPVEVRLAGGSCFGATTPW